MGKPADEAFGKTVQVDLAGLVDLARVVRNENQRTLLPQSGLINTDLGAGVCFGGSSASGDVYRAKVRYAKSLARATQQLNAFIRAAEVLATAAEQVARNYSDVDAMSAARSRDVESALSAAVIAAEKVVEQPTRGL